ncbi:MAG: ComF family protein [Pseudomonadota bacterium]
MSDIALCTECTMELPYPEYGCKRCGIELGLTPPAHGYCGRCLLEPPSFDRCVPVFRYEFPVRELIAGFKFHAGFAEGRTLARLLCERAEHCFAIHGKPQRLLPIPLHTSRLRERGFNQSTELARVIGRHCDIAVADNGCRRSRATPSQKGLSAEERATNLRNAFTLHGDCADGSLKHVAIVDDVVTTMTTVDTLARLLRSAGIARIDVLCLARVS